MKWCCSHSGWVFPPTVKAIQRTSQQADLIYIIPQLRLPSQVILGGDKLTFKTGQPMTPLAHTAHHPLGLTECTSPWRVEEPLNFHHETNFQRHLHPVKGTRKTLSISPHPAPDKAKKVCHLLKVVDVEGRNEWEIKTTNFAMWRQEIWIYMIILKGQIGLI